MADALAVWIGKFLDYLHIQQNVSPHTLRNYESDLMQFHQYLTTTPGGEERPAPELEQLDNLTIREFLGVLYEKKNKKSSVARKLATLRSFMKYLTAQGAIRLNSAKFVSSPKQDVRLPDYMSLDAAASLMDAPDASTDAGKRDRAILELLYGSGLRVGELVGLNLGDFSLNEGLVRVLGKGRKERIVPFGSQAAKALEAYLRVRCNLVDSRKSVKAKFRAADAEAVFLNLRGGRLTTHSIG